MSLSFPNPSRTYDAPRRRIRFWGYDQSMEVTFFVEEEAIFKLCPKTPDVEAGILAAFDTVRERINAVADRMYAPKSRRAFYLLAAYDF
jgi:hypothetical protein